MKCRKIFGLIQETFWPNSKLFCINSKIMLNLSKINSKLIYIKKNCIFSLQNYELPYHRPHSRGILHQKGHKKIHTRCGALFRQYFNALYEPRGKIRNAIQEGLGSYNIHTGKYITNCRAKVCKHSNEH